jgi:DNA invertase Pin-like site-specific DNA recombinase
MDGGVDFVAADMPNADRFMLHIRACVAEEERRMIAERTKAGLAAARARGVQLGNPNLAEAHREATDARDADLRPILETMHGMSYRAIADALAKQGVKTPRGNATWGAMTVMRAMKRLGIANPGRAQA